MKLVAAAKAVPTVRRRQYLEVGAAPTTKEAQAIADEIFSLFVSEEVDKVELIYTKFVSLIKSDPVVHTLLPLSPAGESLPFPLPQSPRSMRPRAYQIPPFASAHHPGASLAPRLPTEARFPPNPRLTARKRKRGAAESASRRIRRKDQAQAQARKQINWRRLRSRPRGKRAAGGAVAAEGDEGKLLGQATTAGDLPPVGGADRVCRVFCAPSGRLPRSVLSREASNLRGDDGFVMNQYRDQYFLEKLLNLRGDDGFVMNQVLVALWNLMAWPFLIASFFAGAFALLPFFAMLPFFALWTFGVPDTCLSLLSPFALLPFLPSGHVGNHATIPAWPFLIASFFAGAFALLPFFALWTPSVPDSCLPPPSPCPVSSNRTTIPAWPFLIPSFFAGAFALLPFFALWTNRTTIPAWPFLIASFFAGAFALLPFFALWTPGKAAVPTEEERGKVGLKVLESKVTSALLLLAASGLVISAATAPSTDWLEFLQYFQESLLIHVTSMDFVLLNMFLPFWLFNDMAYRNWAPRDSWGVALPFLPVIGPALYLVMRPGLPPPPPAAAESKSE
ncbi:unnamed protein product [Closterium sp. NIES-64]|nr:unnamed protein product [Closterium sp. NIES-64]